jgi:hypothetical protein
METKGGVIPEAKQIVVQRSAAKAAAKVKVDPAIIPGKLNLNLLRNAMESNRRPRDGLILLRTFVDGISTPDHCMCSPGSPVHDSKHNFKAMTARYEYLNRNKPR